ncbi:MAG: bifunctional 3-deoxy-7-phosphoheptulonate synthase/chorismate mutase [Deltaproteobacteria bacterium]|nr:bifunctional 3-deoxy-7-phosphoheptulonate synthase/chorismate mutase [Deltaproteobacteria bacterium]
MKEKNSSGSIRNGSELAALRDEITDFNLRILDLLNRRAGVVRQVREFKERHAMDMFSPSREKEMLDILVEANRGPFDDSAVRHLFREVFRTSLGMMESPGEKRLVVSRGAGCPDVVVRVGDREVGRAPIIIAGPCSVEDREQMDMVGGALSRLGVGFLRGGAFKPRTSPYSFQGLGEEGVLMLEEVGRRHGMATVSEVVDTRTVSLMAEHVDLLQVGSRNMANYELLKEVAGTGKPVLLKRGFAATLNEFMRAAEYLASAGNENLILCERGIRSFERETRFTLDLSAVPLLKSMCRLPVIVDVSHAAGRRDVIPALARAALAAGAHGVMIEVHPNPVLARSDSQQQLDLEQFEAFLDSVETFLKPSSQA